MIVDGRAIAGEIKEGLKAEVARRDTPPTLFVFMAGENMVSEKFLGVKERFAHDIGIPVLKKHFPGDVDTLHLAAEIAEIAQGSDCGIIVQLPLPSALNTKEVLDVIPPHMDPDMLSSSSMMMFENGRAKILPPVTAAIAEILQREHVVIKDKNVVIIGKGRLVGAPAAVWFRHQGGNVEVLDSKTLDIGEYTRNADIIVTGVGKAGLLTPEIIKDGVVILDAATSEASGKLAGDADPACASKASVFTPVPGGIGPITVAMLYKNLLILTRGQSRAILP
ncbi:MAG: bifunctional 5,10-methylenetetrahydrofolate dehydrogenase/5,10-methenyltetrahydrofolate cyclohydrolase [Parcubacteria group bacterium]|nr:bifunctional 5,10-methylenetetrahydrofolate dehydrogenase/5,10-methenyltetrahydrofolate cyclohydrolase [Parcubacteria group bacterium]